MTGSAVTAVDVWCSNLFDYMGRGFGRGGHRRWTIAGSPTDCLFSFAVFVSALFVYELLVHYWLHFGFVSALFCNLCFIVCCFSVIISH